MGSEHSPETVETRPDQAMVQAGEALWQLPFTVFTAWWNIMASPYLSLAAHPHRDEHEQLVVPEPLEETSERALFA